MLTLLRFHLWRKQSMDCCRLVALLYVTFVFLCVHSLCMHACVQAFLQFCLHAFFLLHMTPSVQTSTVWNLHTPHTAHTPTPCLHLYALCSWHCLCFSLLVAPKLSPPDRQPRRGGNGRTPPAAPTAVWAPPQAKNAAPPPTSASPVRYL